MDLHNADTDELKALQGRISKELEYRESGYSEAVRVNPRWSYKEWETYVMYLGHGEAIATAGRRSGRTTATALSLIGLAMANPGVIAYAVDHRREDHENVALALTVRRLIKALSLEHLHCDTVPEGGGGLPYRVSCVYKREL